jgi:GMP synthase (glutamine-hydrolysing)
MRIHYIQHVPFEGPASIAKWAETHAHTMTATCAYHDPVFPEVSEFEWLIIMGGPMNIYEEDKYPWLTKEKNIIRQSIDSGKIVIGICLGAQLIADVLGADIYPNQHKEIGWFPVELTSEGKALKISGWLPSKFLALHWHGDTFDLPNGAVHLLKSEGCQNQAFLYNGKILGLQFHLESTPKSVNDLVQNCINEIVPGTYIQTVENILSRSDDQYKQLNNAMFGILDRMLIHQGNTPCHKI